MEHARRAAVLIGARASRWAPRGRSVLTGARASRWAPRGRSLALAAHWVFALLVAVGCAVRVVVTLAYRPALFYSDSVDYLSHAYRLPLSGWHPPGYSIFLRLILSTGTLTAIPIAQHVLIVLGSVLLYATLIRVGARPGLAALATAPLLLDGYQLQIEQYVLSEALFEALIIAIIAVLLWRPYLTSGRIALTGVLLGAAVLVRLDAIGLALPVAVYAVARWAGGRRTVAMLGIAALPVLGLASMRAAEGNGLSVTGGMTGIWLYGRVAPFADCATARIPASQRQLCPTQPLGERPGTSWFENSQYSPARVALAGHAPSSAELSDFAWRIIAAQPLDYLHAVAVDFLSQFRLTRAPVAGGATSDPWIFATTVSARDRFSPNPAAMVALYGGPRPELNPRLAGLLNGYQQWLYVPGPVMAICLLLALAGIRRPSRASHRQMSVALLAGFGVVVVLWATATVEFTWRYVLPTLVVFPAAAVLSVESGFGRSRVAPVVQREGTLSSVTADRDASSIEV